MARKLNGLTATQTRPARLSELVAGIRSAVDNHADWAQTAQLVADQLRRHLPGPDVLSAQQRLGSPDDCSAHNLRIEPEGSFSIVALHEELYDADLNLVGRSDNHVGDVSAFASAPAPAATTTELDRDRKRKPTPPDHQRSSSHVTRPRPQLRHLTRRLRNR